jgi:hypothetical protein
MKDNFSIKNFGVQNTPKWAQKTGDALLLAGTLGLAIVGFPATAAAVAAEAGIVLAFQLPAGVLLAGKGLVAIGVAGKLFTKFFGLKTEEVNVEEAK